MWPIARGRVVSAARKHGATTGASSLPTWWRSDCVNVNNDDQATKKKKKRSDAWEGRWESSKWSYAAVRREKGYRNSINFCHSSREHSGLRYQNIPSSRGVGRLRMAAVSSMLIVDTRRSSRREILLVLWAQTTTTLSFIHCLRPVSQTGSASGHFPASHNFSRLFATPYIDLHRFIWFSQRESKHRTKFLLIMKHHFFTEMFVCDFIQFQACASREGIIIGSSSSCWLIIVGAIPFDGGLS